MSVSRSAKLASFLLACLCWSVGLAHQPFWNAGSPSLALAFGVEEPTVSKAIFGELAAGGVAYFALEVNDDFPLDVSLFVGQGCSEAFTPQLWLARAGAVNTSSDVELPEGYGLEAGVGAWRPYRGHGLQGREGPEITSTLQAGTHYLIVTAPEVGGYYLLSLAGEESFGGTPEGRSAIPRFNACG